MSSFLINWVQKRPNGDFFTNKKKCVKLTVQPNEETTGNVENTEKENEKKTIKNKSLGCLVCKCITNLGLSFDQNLRLSKPWQDFSIISSEVVIINLKKKQIEKSFESSHKSNMLTTEKSLNLKEHSLTYQMKHCTSYSIGNKKKLFAKISYQLKKIISILIDESTTFSKLTTLVVVIRTFFEDYPGDPYTFNLDFIELPNTQLKQ
ncbi:hypothetical protein AGLY_015857 [Aphis glycines]|uniref:DUF4371 domain-containing protein n=1 Tax=Aphis glycines TaxID=307491 RepID=A0A6G0T1L6_APHGL|nr:hypothetical protein AGLY_015857 [Aphis glycines]